MARKARPVALSPEELRFDLGEWLRRHAVVEAIGKSEWLLQCPACGREKLAVNPGRRAYGCWTCDFRGWSPIKLVAAILDCSWDKATAVVAAGASGINLGPVAPLRAHARPKAAEPPVGPIPRGVINGLTPWAAAYAARRGIPWDHAVAFGLGSVEDDGTSTKANAILRRRLFLPAWSPTTGRLVFWQARDTTDKHPLKIIGAPLPCGDPEVHPAGCACVHEEWGLPAAPNSAGKEECVFGIHLARPGGRVIVVEGPVDSAVCGPDFVATWGAAMSATQAAIIAGTGAAEAVVLYDGDEAGHCGTYGLDKHGQRTGPGALGLLAALLPTRAARCPAGSDPGVLGRAVCMRLADAATSSEQVPGLGSYGSSAARGRHGGSRDRGDLAPLGPSDHSSAGRHRL